MKKISVLIPTFNEEENIKSITTEVEKELQKLKKYEYEIIVIDNDSKDKTRQYLEEITAKNKKIKTIFNVKNFGQFNSPFYGMLQTSGDCVISICADFQDPVNLIPVFIKYWEEGYKIVCGIKSKSQENKIMYFLRSCYYKLIKNLSTVEQIEHFTGFGLYDKSFIEVLKKLDDPTPFLRGIVAELGFKRKDVPYEQAKRRAGKTHNNFYSLYDAAMLSFTSYTKVGLRLATFIGSIIGILSLICAFIYFIFKLIYWNEMTLGIAPLVIGMFFLGSVQLFFIGLLGEYILNINTKVTKRPLVIEEKRINF